MVLLFSQNKIVNWEVNYDKSQLKQGNTVQVVFTGTVADGYKIYSLNQKEPALTSYALSFVPDKKMQKATVGEIRERSTTHSKREDIQNADFVFTEKKIIIEQDFVITGEEPIIKGQLIYTITNDILNNQRKAFSFHLK